MPSLNLFLINAILAGLLMATSLISMDWMSTIAAATALVVFIIPYRRDNLMVNSVLLLLTNCVAIGLIAFSRFLIEQGMHIQDIIGVDILWTVQLLLLSAYVYLIGYVIAILIDHYSESTLTFGWYSIFAAVFTFSFSVIYLFSVGALIMVEGRPFSNEDVQIYGNLAISELMYPSCCAILVGVVLAIFSKSVSIRANKDQLLEEISDEQS